MFNLSEIDFIRTDNDHGQRGYSFVGIQRSKGYGGRLEFWLPFGFDDFAKSDKEEENFETTKTFFFKMYRTFKTYIQRRQLRNNPLTETDIAQNRDGLVEQDKGFSFINENNEQVLFYSKLNALDKILEGYDELRISSLEKKQVRTQDLDYSKMYKYLHKAIYLEGGVIYLDEMNLAKNVLVRESPPILQMFCFIYTEIKRELEEEATIPLLAAEIAETFKENYLQIDSSLFAQDTFADTISTLKNLLEDIDLTTTYKDEDYWHFFEAVEAFLYGEMKDDKEGVYWGMSSFYDIWEDICQVYMLNNEPYKTQAIFADVNGYLQNLKKLDINPYNLNLQTNKNISHKDRYIRPDLVLREQNSIRLKKESLLKDKPKEIKKNDKKAFIVLFKTYLSVLEINHKEVYDLYIRLSKEEPNNDPTKKPFRYLNEDDYGTFMNYFENYKYKIIDYKYMRVSDYQNYNPFQTENGENKITSDIHKQLIYEWTTQKNFENAETESEFWMPCYLSDKDMVFPDEPVNITNPIFIRSKIKIVQVNFIALQNFYVKLLQTV